MKIALAQTKPVTGDLEGNVAQIIRDIRKAKSEDADLVIFPETAITGYCCGALYEQTDFVLYNKMLLEEVIAKEVPEGMVGVVGFVDPKRIDKNGRLEISNSAAIMQGGKIIDIYDKILLANDDHHEDRKYFTPGQVPKVIEIDTGKHKFNLGTIICEDAWSNSHDRDIVQETKELGADIIACINQSYFYNGKQEIRHEIFGGHAKEKQIPFISIKPMATSTALS